jgi:transcriptional regulator with XRE-family HTH domain
MPQKTPKSLGARIEMLRKGFRHNQTKVAKIIGVSRAAVHQWESGKTRVSEENLERLSTRYGVKFEWLAFARGPAPDFAMLAKQFSSRPLSDAERLDLIPFLHDYTTIEVVKSGPASTALAWRIPQIVGEGLGVDLGKVLVWHSTSDCPPLRRGDYAFVDTSRKASTSETTDAFWLVKAGGRLTIVREPPRDAKVIGRVVAAFTAL